MSSPATWGVGPPPCSMSPYGRCAGICNATGKGGRRDFWTAGVARAPGSPRPRRQRSSRPNEPGRIALPGSSGTSSGHRSRGRLSGRSSCGPGSTDSASPRFILTGAFFLRKFRINLFTVMYAAFIRWGLPQTLLADRESQFTSTSPIGEADYQYYARRLGIDLVYARRARTKGKIERLFQFIQRDFVREHLEATSVAAVNAAFAQWIEAYNLGQASRALDGEAPAAHYVPSTRRLRPEELELLLVDEEPRKVARTGTISDYGRHYRVPDPYIGRWVWTRLRGDRLTI
jgi:hypothetical protein